MKIRTGFSTYEEEEGSRSIGNESRQGLTRRVMEEIQGSPKISEIRHQNKITAKSEKKPLNPFLPSAKMQGS